MHQDKKIYGVGTVGEKGQIVIPIEARDELKISTGDKFIFFGAGSTLHMIEANKLNEMLEKAITFSSKIERIKESVQDKLRDSK